MENNNPPQYWVERLKEENQIPSNDPPTQLSLVSDQVQTSRQPSLAGGEEDFSHLKDLKKAFSPPVVPTNDGVEIRNRHLSQFASNFTGIGPQLISADQALCGGDDHGRVLTMAEYPIFLRLEDGSMQSLFLDPPHIQQPTRQIKYPKTHINRNIPQLAKMSEMLSGTFVPPSPDQDPAALKRVGPRRQQQLLSSGTGLIQLQSNYSKKRVHLQSQGLPIGASAGFGSADKLASQFQAPPLNFVNGQFRLKEKKNSIRKSYDKDILRIEKPPPDMHCKLQELCESLNDFSRECNRLSEEDETESKNCTTEGEYLKPQHARFNTIDEDASLKPLGTLETGGGFLKKRRNLQGGLSASMTQYPSAEKEAILPATIQITNENKNGANGTGHQAHSMKTIDPSIETRQSEDFFKDKPFQTFVKDYTRNSDKQLPLNLNKADHILEKLKKNKLRQQLVNTLRSNNKLLIISDTISPTSSAGKIEMKDPFAKQSKATSRKKMKTLRADSLWQPIQQTQLTEVANGKYPTGKKSNAYFKKKLQQGGGLRGGSISKKVIDRVSPKKSLPITDSLKKTFALPSAFGESRSQAMALTQRSKMSTDRIETLPPPDKSFQVTSYLSRKSKMSNGQKPLTININTKTGLSASSMKNTQNANSRADNLSKVPSHPSPGIKRGRGDMIVVTTGADRAIMNTTTIPEEQTANESTLNPAADFSSRMTKTKKGSISPVGTLTKTTPRKTVGHTNPSFQNVDNLLNQVEYRQIYQRNQEVKTSRMAPDFRFLPKPYQSKLQSNLASSDILSIGGSMPQKSQFNMTGGIPTKKSKKLNHPVKQGGVGRLSQPALAAADDQNNDLVAYVNAHRLQDSLIDKLVQKSLAVNTEAKLQEGVGLIDTENPSVSSKNSKPKSSRRGRSPMQKDQIVKELVSQGFTPPVPIIDENQIYIRQSSSSSQPGYGSASRSQKKVPSIKISNKQSFKNSVNHSLDLLTTTRRRKKPTEKPSRRSSIQTNLQDDDHQADSFISRAAQHHGGRPEEAHREQTGGTGGLGPTSGENELRQDEEGQTENPMRSTDNRSNNSDSTGRLFHDKSLMEIVSNNSDEKITPNKNGLSNQKNALSKTAKDGFYKASEFHLGPPSQNRQQTQRSRRDGRPINQQVFDSKMTSYLKSTKMVIGDEENEPSSMLIENHQGSSAIGDQVSSSKGIRVSSGADTVPPGQASISQDRGIQPSSTTGTAAQAEVNVTAANRRNLKSQGIKVREFPFKNQFSRRHQIQEQEQLLKNKKKKGEQAADPQGKFFHQLKKQNEAKQMRAANITGEALLQVQQNDGDKGTSAHDKSMNGISASDHPNHLPNTTEHSFMAHPPRQVSTHEISFATAIDPKKAGSMSPKRSTPKKDSDNRLKLFSGESKIRGNIISRNIRNQSKNSSFQGTTTHKATIDSGTKATHPKIVAIIKSRPKKSSTLAPDSLIAGDSIISSGGKADGFQQSQAFESSHHFASTSRGGDKRDEVSNVLRTKQLKLRTNFQKQQKQQIQLLLLQQSQNLLSNIKQRKKRKITRHTQSVETADFRKIEITTAERSRDETVQGRQSEEKKAEDQVNVILGPISIVQSHHANQAKRKVNQNSYQINSDFEGILHPSFSSGGPTLHGGRRSFQHSQASSVRQSQPSSHNYNSGRIPGSQQRPREYISGGRFNQQTKIMNKAPTRVVQGYTKFKEGSKPQITQRIGSHHQQSIKIIQNLNSDFATAPIARGQKTYRPKLHCVPSPPRYVGRIRNNQQVYSLNALKGSGEGTGNQEGEMIGGIHDRNESADRQEFSLSRHSSEEESQNSGNSQTMRLAPSSDLKMKLKRSSIAEEYSLQTSVFDKHPKPGDESSLFAQHTLLKPEMINSIKKFDRINLSLKKQLTTSKGMSPKAKRKNLKKTRMSRLNSTVNHISNEDIDDDFSKQNVTASFNQQSNQHLHLPYPENSATKPQFTDLDKKRINFQLTGQNPETIVKNSMESFKAIPQSEQCLNPAEQEENAQPVVQIDIVQKKNASPKLKKVRKI